MTKTLNQIFFFFPPPKSDYFFQQHWESEYFFLEKKHTPIIWHKGGGEGFKLKWSLPNLILLQKNRGETNH